MEDTLREPGDNQDYDVFREESSSLEVVEENAPKNKKPSQDPLSKKRKGSSRKRLIIRSIVVLIILAIAVAVGLMLRERLKGSGPSTVTINTQSLDNGTLNQLTTTTGDNKQQLTIFPDTLFKNNVEVQRSTNLQSDLTVEGQTRLKGPVTMQQGLSVGGNLTVTGSISGASLSVGNLTISTVSVSSDVAFGGHLVPNGGIPAVKASLAASGGSVNISGNDTAGTIIINIGGGALQSGELAIITFNKPFNTTPKVQLTPITLSGSNLRYYATRSALFFTINTGNAPTADTSYGFDYFVTQ